MQFVENLKRFLNISYINFKPVSKTHKNKSGLYILSGKWSIIWYIWNCSKLHHKRVQKYIHVYLDVLQFKAYLLSFKSDYH